MVLFIVLHIATLLAYGLHQKIRSLPAVLLHAATLAGHFHLEPRLGLGVIISFFFWGTVPITLHRLQFGTVRYLLAALAAASAFAPFLLPTQAAAPPLSAHAVLALSAYIAAAAAFFHWLDIVIAEKRLRQQPSTTVGTPLLDGERLCFRLLAVSFALIMLTLVSGVATALVNRQPLFELTHKNLFALLTSLTFLILLIGRHRYGWRGALARRCFFAGYAFLLLSHIGSTFVLQVILGK